MRCIDADAVIKEQHDSLKRIYGKKVSEIVDHIGVDDDLSVPLHAMENYARAKQFYYWLKGILEEQPSVDPGKELHSYWEKENTPMGNFICHECGEYPAFDSEGYVLYGYAPDYCPNCGAKMDGGMDNATD